MRRHKMNVARKKSGPTKLWRKGSFNRTSKGRVTDKPRNGKISH